MQTSSLRSNYQNHYEYTGLIGPCSIAHHIEQAHIEEHSADYQKPEDSQLASVQLSHQLQVEQQHHFYQPISDQPQLLYQTSATPIEINDQQHQLSSQQHELLSVRGFTSQQFIHHQPPEGNSYSENIIGVVQQSFQPDTLAGSEIDSNDITSTATCGPREALIIYQGTEEYQKNQRDLAEPHSVEGEQISTYYYEGPQVQFATSQESNRPKYTEATNSFLNPNEGIQLQYQANYCNPESLQYFQHHHQHNHRDSVVDYDLRANHAQAVESEIIEPSSILYTGNGNHLTEQASAETIQLQYDNSASSEYPQVSLEHHHLSINQNSPATSIISSEESSSLTRDERRAREANIPLSYLEIVNLSIDKFNELLAKFPLTETQLTLIKDIRRRGKNKVAAQSCRKRKMEQIYELQLEVNGLANKRKALSLERSQLIEEHEALARDYDNIHSLIQDSLLTRTNSSGIPPM